MKSIYFLLFTLLLTSCNELPLNKYELDVVVFYPTTNDTIKLVGYFNDTPRVSSDRGSNSIYVDDGYVGKTCLETSAPIKIINSRILY